MVYIKILGHKALCALCPYSVYIVLSSELEHYMHCILKDAVHPLTLTSETALIVLSYLSAIENMTENV